MNKLYQLRGIFILYMAAKTVVEIALGSNITLESLGGGHFSWFGDLFTSSTALSIISIVGNAILLLLGLGLFYFLLHKANWSRILLLIVGWLNIADALLGILFRSQISRMMTQMVDTPEWNQLLLIDRTTDILGLIFWGYLVYVLQFNGRVKQSFMPLSAGPATGQSA